MERKKHTLIIIDNIAQMITSTIMSFTHTHRVVSEVDIAVIAFKDVLASWSRRWRWSLNSRKSHGALILNLQKTVRVVSIYTRIADVQKLTFWHFGGIKYLKDCYCR